jgi:hypothetical protein
MWNATARVGRSRTLTSLQPAAAGTKITITARIARGSAGEIQERIAASLRQDECLCGSAGTSPPDAVPQHHPAACRAERVSPQSLV